MSDGAEFLEAMRRVMAVAAPADVKIIVENANAAKLAEREECAKLADEESGRVRARQGRNKGAQVGVALNIAAAIRARK